MRRGRIPGRGVDLVGFRKGECKDDVTTRHLRRWSGGEGVPYIGDAGEKARVPRTQRRVDPATGKTWDCSIRVMPGGDKLRLRGCFGISPS